MIYCISDIHNHYAHLRNLLDVIKYDFEKDTLYVLGDIFDCGGAKTEPLELFDFLYESRKSIFCLKGNHDVWVKESIDNYIHTGSFHSVYETMGILLESNVSKEKLECISKFIEDMPLQHELCINDKKYLLAHAQTSLPYIIRSERFYTMGLYSRAFFENGVEDERYISVVGHIPTDCLHFMFNLSPKLRFENGKNTIWIGEHVIDIDCGLGADDDITGRLGCICLDDMSTYYV